MKRPLAAALVLWGLVAVARGGEPAAPGAALDLPGALAEALARNRELALAGLGVEQRAGDLETAALAFQWTVRPELRAGRAADGAEAGAGVAVAKQATGGLRVEASGALDRYADLEPDPWRSVVRLEVAQPLLRRAGREATLEPLALASERLRAERRRWEQLKSDLALEVVRGFADTLRREALAESEERLAARLDRLLALVRARERQGRATRVETLRVELQRGEAQARLANHRAALDRARRDLADLLGREPGAGLRLEAPPLPEVGAADVEALVRAAMAQRLDLAQAEQDADSAERGLRLARRGTRPDLSAVARVERLGTGASSGDAIADPWETRWFAGVVANTDYGVPRERIALRLAELAAESGRQVLALRRRAVARDVQKAFADARASRAEVDLAERDVAVAAARVGLARRLFEAGRGGPADVSDAEDAARAAADRRIEVRARAVVDGYALLRASGSLVESPPELRPGVGPEGPPPEDPP